MKIRKNNTKMIGIILSIMIVSFVGLAQWSIIKIREELEYEAKESLEEVSNQGAAVVQNKLHNYESKLETLAKLDDISSSSISIQEKVEILSNEASKNEFLDMGIIDTSGNVHTTKGEKVDVSSRNYFKKAMEGKTNTSTVLSSLINNEKIIVHAVPIISYEKIVGIVFATSDADKVQKEIFPYIYSGKSDLYILDENFNKIFRSNENKNNKKYYQLIDEYESDLLVKNIRTKKVGVSKLNTSEGKIYIGYTPIEKDSGWTLVSLAKESIVSSRAEKIMSNIIQIITGLNFIFIGIIAYIMMLDKKNKKEIYNIAFVDEVTGSRNYSKFMVDVSRLLEERKNNNYAIVYFDIDSFEIINETFGENFANAVLKYISRVLEESLPSSSIYARRHTDNFVFISSYRNNKKEIEDLVVDICEKIRNIQVENITGYVLDTTAGIYYDVNKDISLSHKIGKANLARQSIKGDKTRCYNTFSKEMGNKQIEEINLESEIKIAIENNELEVYYQPKIDVLSEKVVGAEALLRWKTKDGKFIGPDKFIPIAEKNGFIGDIDNWVFKKVFSDIKEWKDKNMNLYPISINLSRVNLYKVDLIKSIKEYILEYEVDPSLVEIEITETAAARDLEFTINKIKEIKQLGVNISMDDFGIGQSSLSNLSILPIDTVKLDRSFIKNIDNDHKSRKVLKSIIYLAKSLELNIVAEGVEKQVQRDYLEELGCDSIQGFYYAKPMEKKNFEKFVFDIANNL